MTNTTRHSGTLLALIVLLLCTLSTGQKLSSHPSVRSSVTRKTLPRNESVDGLRASAFAPAYSVVRKSSIFGKERLLRNALKVLTYKPFNDFDWKLTKILDETEKNNLIVSTISVKLVIAMLYLGVHDQIAKEIEDAFSVNSTSKNAIIREFSEILHSLENSKNENYRLNIGTQLYVDKSSNVTRTFQDDLLKHFNANVKQLDFKQADLAVQTINSWCSLITKEKIQKLITKDDISEATAMMLVNAVFFRGEWERQFPPDNTIVDTFLQHGKIPSLVPIMVTKDNFYYHNMTELRAHLLRMPYAGGKFAMYILVPYDVDGLAELGKKLSPQYLAESLNNMTEKLIHLRMPKFHFESSAALVPLLKKLGIKELFNPTANLVNIGSSSRGPLMISNILQKSGIEVNEKGSLAYAATEVHIVSRFGQDILDINVTHPFYFLIADEERDAIIFIGKVVSPPVVEDSVSNSSSNEITNRYAGTKQPNESDEEAEEVQKDKYNYFDKELLQNLAKLIPESNIIVSPASIKSSLALLIAGAGGNTEIQLKNALRLPSDKKKMTALLQHQRKALKYKSQISNMTLNSQNKIYVAPGEKLLPEYKNIVKDTYQSDIEILNFANSDAAVKQINKWINNATDGLIPTLVNKDHFDTMTRLLLINCLYFKADWANEFNADLTRKDCFYDLKSQCQQTFFIYGRRETKFYHSKLLEAKIIEIPFKDPRYSMIFMLPNQEYGVYNLLKDLVHQDINALLSNLKKVTVQVTLPKTTIEFSNGLSNALHLVDITDIFSPAANLTGVLDASRNVLVRDIIHKAKIEINEKGAKAAAATESQVVLLSAFKELEFKANHPFLFFIRDANDAGFLFEGLVVRPDPANGSKTQAQPVSNKKETVSATSNDLNSGAYAYHRTFYNGSETALFNRKLPPPPLPPIRYKPFPI